MKKIFSNENLLFICANFIKSILPVLIFPFCLQLMGVNEFGILSGQLAVAMLLSFAVDYSVMIYGTGDIVNASESERSLRIKTMILMRVIIFIVLIILFIAPVLIIESKYINESFALFILSGLTVIFDLTWLYLWTKDYIKYFCSFLFGFALTLTAALIANARFEVDEKLMAIYLIMTPILLSNIIAFVLIFFNKTIFVNRFDSFYVLAINVRLEFIRATPIFFSQAISALYSTTGPIILNNYGRPDLAALWTIINRITIGAGNFATLPVKSSISKICMQWSDGDLPMNKSVKKFLYIYIYSISLLLLPIFFGNDLVSRLLFKNEYVFNIFDKFMVAGWMLIPFLSYIGTTYLVYIRDNRRLIILTFTNLIIHIILSYPLTKIFNLAGYMLSMLLSQVYLLYILKYKHNKK